MADFVQTMKDWRRMCVAHRDVCQTCRLGRLNGGCCGVYEGGMDYVQVESAVTAWAAEHPAPVYPTWFEVLEKLGVAGRIDAEPYYDSRDKGIYLKQPAFTPKAFEPIPSDTAEKLGIGPKEA